MNPIGRSIVLLLFFFGFGCSHIIGPDTGSKGLVEVSVADFPEFKDDIFYDGMAHCLRQSLAYLKRMPSAHTFRFGDDTFDAVHMIRSLEVFLAFIEKKPDSQALNRFMRENYRVYRSVGSNGGSGGGAGNPTAVLFTGYYEPLLMGTQNKKPGYTYPIYARPEDIVSIDLSKFSPQYRGQTIVGRYTGETVVPYYERRQIDSEGALQGKTEPLAWIQDPIDLFFLQIQGSGKVFLDTGQTLHVHYHISNGHPYRSIGKLLIDAGKIPREQMSMQAIRTYLKNHPLECQTIMNHNPSYVFFKLEEDGPVGYLGVTLTSGRSLAVDRRIFPLGGLAFMQTQKPLIDADGNIDRWVDCTRFAASQDVGGAIRGPGRADLFWGNGPYAEIAAGHLKHPGRLYFLVLNPSRSS
jgi:membrane-bound lytic murein transglycosylase A